MKNSYSQKWQNTVISLLIAMTIVFSMLPISAFAQNPQDIIILGDSDFATPATTSGGDGMALTDDDEDCSCGSFCSDPDCTVCKDDKTQCFYYYCICESICDEDNQNADCPVCADDYTSCAQAVDVPELAATAVTGGLTFNDATASDSGDGWVWNTTNNTLTLTNFTLTSSDTVPALMLLCDSTIVLNGNNTITNTSTTGNGGGIFSANGCTLTIRKGSGAATLAVSSSSTTLTTNAIHVVGNLIMESGNITATAAGDFGLLCVNNFTMSGGTIIAQGATSAASVMYGTPPSNIIIKGHGGSAFDNDAEFIERTDVSDTPYYVMLSSNNTVDVTYAKITVPAPYNYTLAFDSVAGELQNKSDSSVKPFAKGTDYTVSGTTLTLKEGFEFVTSANVALELPAGMTIKVDGDSRIESTFSGSSNGSRGIDAFGALTIDVAANKTLTVISGSGTMNAGINTAGSLTKSGTGTLKSTGSSGTGGYPYSQGICVNAGSFIMNGGTVYADIPVSATGDAMYVQGNNVPENIIVMGESTPGSGTYDAEAQFTGGWIFLITDPTTAIKAAKITVPAPTPPAPSGGGSKDTPAPSANPWLEPNPAQTLSSGASQTKSDYVRTSSNSTYGVRGDSWQKLKGKKFEHDTMDGRAVEVRLYIDNPENMKRDMYVTGHVRGVFVENRKGIFKKFYKNELQVVHMDEQKNWDAPVRIAAKLDLSKMNTKNLYFYSYNAETHSYSPIPAPEYRIDKNGYLHFTTPYAGDIIISDGKLENKQPLI